MKKVIAIILVFILGSFFIYNRLSYAQTEPAAGANCSDSAGIAQNSSVEAALQNILVKQNVTTIQGLDLSKISDEDWEVLGDAVMEQQHPGQAHEVMDQMMGGEGSESLTQMHINMGKAYLGYGNGYGNGYGMMGTGGMMGYSRQYPERGFGSMMGCSSGYLGGSGILGSVVLISLTSFFLAGTYYFIKRSVRK